MGLRDRVDDLLFEIEGKLDLLLNRDPGWDEKARDPEGLWSPDENDFYPVTIGCDEEEVEPFVPSLSKLSVKREYYPVPDSLLWAMPEPWMRQLAPWTFERESERLLLMAQTLAYGMQQARGTYGVWYIYEAFKDRLSLHKTTAMGKKLEAAGILIRPPQRNRPRRINVPKARQFISTVVKWVESEPVVEVLGGDCQERQNEV